MNLLSISQSYLKYRRLSTLLNILLLALGISIITVILLVTNQLEEKFTKNVAGIQMVVGAKGSPLQIILCAVYHIDYPTGNIRLDDVQPIVNNPLVIKAIPLGLGDSYEGFRIVGTNADYIAHYQAKISQGRLWQKPLEVVIGYEVALQLNLKVGATFKGAHGLATDGEAHEEAYQVVGILQKNGTVVDRLIITDLESIWHVHEEHDETENEVKEAKNDVLHDEHQHEKNEIQNEKPKEITALLLQFKSPLGMVMLPRQINAMSNLQSAVPATEMSRLFQLIGVGADILKFLAYGIMTVAVLSIFTVLYNSLKDKKYDIALMRSLGASALKIFFLILIEGIYLSILGVWTGLWIGHSSIALFNYFFGNIQGESLEAWIWLDDEWYLLALSIGLGGISALLPAIQAYQMDISAILKKK